MRPYVSVVIPAYNTMADIEKTLATARAYFARQPYAHEVIVVNDGSTDATEAAVRAVVPRYPQLRVLVNGTNMGKGYSLRKGILAAAGQHIFYTDGDLAYDLDRIDGFLAPLAQGTHQVVVGSRVHPDSRFQLHPRYFRYVYQRHAMSRGFNWLVRRLFGIRVMDTQCGFKGFTAEAAKAIVSKARVTRFAFDVEVLLIAQRLGYRITELPVRFGYEGEISTVKIARNAWEALVDLARIWWWDQRGDYRRRG